MVAAFAEEELFSSYVRRFDELKLLDSFLMLVLKPLSTLVLTLSIFLLRLFFRLVGFSFSLIDFFLLSSGEVEVWGAGGAMLTALDVSCVHMGNKDQHEYDKREADTQGRPYRLCAGVVGWNLAAKTRH